MVSDQLRGVVSTLAMLSLCAVAMQGACTEVNLPDLLRVELGEQHSYDPIGGLRRFSGAFGIPSLP
jgi:hypothetical protein